MKENYFLDDGTYSASQIIIEMVRRKLDGAGDVTVDLLKQLKEPNDSREYRLKIKVRLMCKLCSALVDMVLQPEIDHMHVLMDCELLFQYCTAARVSSGHISGMGKAPRSLRQACPTVFRSCLTRDPVINCDAYIALAKAHDIK